MKLSIPSSCLPIWRADKETPHTMCMFKQPKPNKVVQQTVPSPQPTAEPTEVGDVRKAEDEELYGGVPDLRVARTSTPASVSTGGAGLKLM